jgi:hypothetical protein
MRRLLLITAGLFMFPTLAPAQIAWWYMGYGNTRGFPGAVYNHSMIMGFEYAPKMLGAGFEWEARRTSTLSVNGYFHLPTGKKKQSIDDQVKDPVLPFLTAGYSHAYLQGRPGLNLFNFGGGVDFFGCVHAEIRDSLSFENAVAHYPEFRIGLNFLTLFAALAR